MTSYTKIQCNKKFDHDTTVALSMQLDRLGIGLYVAANNQLVYANKSFCSLFNVDLSEDAAALDVLEVIGERRDPETGRALNCAMQSTSGSARFRYIIRNRPNHELLLEEESFPCLYGDSPARMSIVKKITPSAPSTVEKKDTVDKQDFASGRCDFIEKEKLCELFGLIYRYTGVSLYNYKPKSLARRIEHCKISAGCRTYREYLDYLKKNPSEINRFIEKFTIGYTEFFRDIAVFDAIRNHILPALVTEYINLRPADTCSREDTGKPFGSRDIRIWCIGCSSGEEAYSVAALALWTCSTTSLFPIVFATDIDMHGLEKARKGLYRTPRCKPVPKEILSRYFLPEKTGWLSVNETLRNAVVFGRHNILRDPVYGHMDLILCRNVLIYLSVKRQEELLASFSWSLKPGGYLVLGSSESLFGETAAKYDIISRELRIYRKKNRNYPAAQKFWE